MQMSVSKVYGVHNVYAGTVLGAPARKGDKPANWAYARKKARKPTRCVDVTHEYVWTWPTSATHGDSSQECGIAG